MNPILPFYSFASLIALLGLKLRDRGDRTLVWLGGWGAMVVVLFAVVFREIRGDTGRYHAAFERMSRQSFAQMWAEADNNWLFAALNWALAQFGTHPLWLIVPITLFCVLMMRHSLRQLLGPTDTAVAMLLYSAYPFFVFYIASGLKQAIAMALLMQGYVALHRRHRVAALLWVAAAPMFHTGAVLVLPFLLVHHLTWRPSLGHRRAMALSLAALVGCTLLSLTGLNQTLMAPVQDYSSFARNYDIYFMEAEEFGYRAGFRADFTLFTFLPLAFAWWLNRQGRGLRAEVSGWWLNLYVLLACIYQLFAFAPFADRFAGFGWYIVPAVVVVMLADSGLHRQRQAIVLGFALANIVILQFYTGRAIILAI